MATGQWSFTNQIKDTNMNVLAKPGHIETQLAVDMEYPGMLSLWSFCPASADITPVVFS